MQIMTKAHGKYHNDMNCIQRAGPEGGGATKALI